MTRPTEPTKQGGGNKLIHGDLTDAIIGAMYAIDTELGYGFLERVYKNAMSVLLRRTGMRAERESPFEIIFMGEQIGFYRADLIVESKVVVEVKTGNFIDPAHVLQLRNYLKASGLQVGLLLNFGPHPEFKRIVWTPRPTKRATQGKPSRRP